MSHRRVSRRRVLIPLILATVLAGEIAGVAVAGRVGGIGPGAAVASPGLSVARAGTHGTGAQDGGGRRPLAPGPAGSRSESERPRGRSDPASAAIRVHVRPERNRGAAARPELAAEVRSVSVSASARHGRNHVWIPSLGVDRAVAAFPCDRMRPPDNHVYRWGCGGRNNVYLLGHAYSVFEPLHDAYVAGRLRKGMTVDYADDSGVVRTYSVAWWRVTRPTSAASWAWAAQSRPSMTLQTCLGSNSELRLIVRLIAIG
jgi:hypothetical protein